MSIPHPVPPPRRRVTTLAVGLVAACVMTVTTAGVASAAPVQVRVAADVGPTAAGAPGVATGIVLSSGRTATITATGTANCSVPDPTNADKLGCRNADANGVGSALSTSLAPGLPAYSLVAEVGTGPLIFVGTGPTVITGVGPLRLGYNDDVEQYFDNGGGFDVTIALNNVAPVLDAVPAQSGPWGTTLTFTARAVDDPTDVLTYSLVGAPAGAAIDPGTGVVTFTPTAAQIGVQRFSVRVQDNGSPALSDETPVQVTVGKRPTVLVYSGATAGQFSDRTQLQATLTDGGGGALQGRALAGQPVTFAVGTQSAAATTDAAGLAQAALTLDQPAGGPGVQTAFAGDAAYLATTDSDPFTVTAEDAVVAYTGPAVAVRVLAPITVSATVTEAADGSLGNRLDTTQLRFTVLGQNGSAIASCTAPVAATTAGAGVGSCGVRLATLLSLGTYRVTVELLGGGRYSAPVAEGRLRLALTVL